MKTTVTDSFDRITLSVEDARGETVSFSFGKWGGRVLASDGVPNREFVRLCDLFRVVQSSPGPYDQKIERLSAVAGQAQSWADMTDGRVS